MARNISFLLTTQQVESETKDVTRRLGWGQLKAGQLLTAVEKGMGLKAGETVRKLKTIRVKSVRREPLNAMTINEAYGRRECQREGFPDTSPDKFVAMFCKHHRGCTPETIVTRIEFEYVAEKPVFIAAQV